MALDELSGPDRSCAGATDDELIGLAWTLEARLPRIGATLDAGIIDYVKG